jgi:hypothetical protein
MVSSTLAAPIKAKKSSSVANGKPQKVGGKYPLVNLGLGLRAQLIECGPALAEDWLAKNRKDQRHISTVRVRDAKRNMLEGRQKVNGQTNVIFDRNDELINGQHTLSAIIESGTTQLLLVVFGVDPTVFDTIDTGRPRSSSDALRMAGYHSTTGLAAAAKSLWKYTKGFVLTPGTTRPSPAELVEFVKKNPDLIECRPMAERVRWICRSIETPLFSAVVFHRINPKLCEQFFEKLATGEELAKGNPILALRKRLLERPTQERHNAVEQFHWFFRTWNAYRAGESLTILQRTVDLTEKLPIPI